MGALTKECVRTYQGQAGLIIDPAMADNVKIWSGGAVGKVAANGLARAFNDGDGFFGFAQESKDNTETGHVAGGKRVQVMSEGVIVLDVVGVDGRDDIGKTVYATTDADFSVTDSGSDVAIGKITEHESGTRCCVAFKATVLP